MTRGATGYFGIYRGVVLNNADPEGTGRLILQIPTVLGNRQSVWAMPSAPPGVVLRQPEPGDHVWVMFEGGATDAPVWMGVGMAEHLAPKPVKPKSAGGSKAFTITMMGA